MVAGRVDGALALRTPGSIAVAISWDGSPYTAQIVQPADGSYTPDLGEQTEYDCKDLDTDKQYFDGRPWESREICTVREHRLDELTASISHERTFPVNFELPVLELPPEAARVDLAQVGGSGTFAMGHVIAFVDADGDGELDLGRLDVEPEQVVARSMGNPVPNSRSKSSYWVVYLDGKIDAANALPSVKETLAALPQGFSLWHTVETAAEDPTQAPLREREVLPISTHVQMYSDPELSRSDLYCEEWQFETQFVAEPFTPEYGYSFCTDGGREYEARKPSEPAGTCRFKGDYYRRNISALSLGDELPADWPCTVQ